MPTVFTANKRAKDKPIDDVGQPKNSFQNIRQNSKEKKVVVSLEDEERNAINGNISKDQIHQLPGHSHSKLAAYNFCPDKVEFVNEDPDEKVILLLRRHPITNVSWILLLIPLVVLPGFVTALFPFELLTPTLQIASLGLWYLFVFGFAIQKFIEWFFNVDIVSDERLIDVNFVNLVYREVTDANVDEIQEVTVEMGGAIRTFFNFGDIIIQTAAEVPRIDFRAIPQPDRVAKILRELRIQEEEEKLEGRVR